MAEQEGQMYHSGVHALSAFYSLTLQALLSLGYSFYNLHCAELLMVAITQRKLSSSVLCLSFNEILFSTPWRPPVQKPVTSVYIKHFSLLLCDPP